MSAILPRIRAFVIYGFKLYVAWGLSIANGARPLVIFSNLAVSMAEGFHVLVGACVCVHVCVRKLEAFFSSVFVLLVYMNSQRVVCSFMHLD